MKSTIPEPKRLQIDTPDRLGYLAGVEKLVMGFLGFVPLLFSISFHEAAHAWTANRYGDPTAKMMGRITLNPIPHIDPLGSIVFPILTLLMPGSIIFGWAKPVMVNEANLRDPRKHGLLVAAAGPLSNLFLALVFSILMAILLRIAPQASGTFETAGRSLWVPFYHMIHFGILINIVLAVFNSLPLPPLDGSRVLLGWFPQIAPQMAILQRFGFVILIVLLVSGAFRFVIGIPTALIYRLLWGLIQ